MLDYDGMVTNMQRSAKAKKLADIAHALATQAPCPLRLTAQHAVPGEGNPEADLFFIGEAPGRQEDATGKPFVGAAGKVLTEFLSLLKLQREDVFITSIEKFRPPNNRDPKPKEIMACFPYLEQQLAVIQPKIIVTLGRHALRRMLEWEKGCEIEETIAMDQLHGRLFQGTSGRLYFPLHHPAATLYQRSLRSTVEKDLKKLASLLKKLTSRGQRS